jgi:acyl-CoA thioester hydrolase
MQAYSKIYEARWADMDANRHMRHSVYNDYAAQTRVAMFSDYGFSIEEISRLGFGPILFREETRFRRELNLLEAFTVTCELTTMRRDGSRWSFLHEIFKGAPAEGVMAAEVVVDGAWLNLDSRKLDTPTADMMEIISQFPRAEHFEWMDEKG